MLLFDYSETIEFTEISIAISYQVKKKYKIQHAIFLIKKFFKKPLELFLNCRHVTFSFETNS